MRRLEKRSTSTPATGEANHRGSIFKMRIPPKELADVSPRDLSSARIAKRLNQSPKRLAVRAPKSRRKSPFPFISST
jgi:hypothetical protein